LPENFNQNTQYFVKLWKTKKFDGELLPIKSSIKYQTYDDLAFDQSFGTTIDRNTKEESQPLIQRIGYNYEVLHNPNK